jgi:hypothetical protein
LEKKKHDKKGEKTLTQDPANLLNSIPKSESGFIFAGDQGKPIKNPPKGFERMRKKAGILDIEQRRDELKKLDGYFLPNLKLYGEKTVRNG